MPKTQDEAELEAGTKVHKQVEAWCFRANRDPDFNVINEAVFYTSAGISLFLVIRNVDLLIDTKNVIERYIEDLKNAGVTPSAHYEAALPGERLSESGGESPEDGGERTN